VDSEMGHVKLVWGSDRDAALQDLAAGGLDGDLYHRPVWKSDEMAKWNGTVMAIDPSGKGKDETGYAIVRFLHGSLYLVAVGGFRDGYSEDTLKALAGAALRHKVNHVIAETNYGGGMFNQLLKPWLIKLGAGKFDEEWKGWSHGMKEERILDILEPVTQSHRLVVDRRVIEEDRKVQEEHPKYSWVYQYTRMARMRGALAHDDRVEAIAMAVGYWTERMDRDHDRAMEQHKESALQKELQDFRRAAFSVTRKSARVYAAR
jgi:hypothetical protein